MAGHVGFDSLPDQLVNKEVNKGFDFNILCVGEWRTSVLCACSVRYVWRSSGVCLCARLCLCVCARTHVNAAAILHVHLSVSAMVGAQTRVGYVIRTH